MIKTGNLTGRLLGFLFLLMWAVPLTGFTQAPVPEVTLSETKIFTGEQFTLSIEVESSGTHSMQIPSLPDFDGARVLSANPSRSTSISIVNGRTTRTTSYIFTLIATEKGSYSVPPINVEIDGEVQQTRPVSFEVVEKGNLSQNGPRNPDIFVQVELDENEPVTGQQIVASVVLYFKQGIEVTSFQPSFGWTTDGFWKEELENISQPRAESTILDGERYRKATLLRYALFPSRSGDLTLSEYGLNVGMRTQRNRNDPFGSFFGSGTNQRRVELTSDPVELTIRSLPEREPSVRLNAVGDINVERTVNKSRIEAGETFELQTTVSGEGNIPLLRRPEYTLPEQVETFTPRETSNIEREGLTIRGEKVFTQQLVTRTPGNISIPEERVAVFNPESRGYSYITLPAIDLEVIPSPTASADNRQPGTILQPVTGLAVWYSASERDIFNRTWFWVLITLPAVVVIAGWIRKRYIERLMTDTTFRRSEYAEQTAAERMEQARTKLQEDDDTKEIYNLIHKSLSGFVSDKLGLPEAGVSDEVLLKKVKEQSVNGQTLQSARYILDKCNTISYAPSGGRDDIEADIDKAEKLIKELKKAL